MDRPLARTPGRGAAFNPANRYDRLSAEAVDDGWAEDGELPVLRTELRVERPRSVITRNASPDVPFDQSLNPYRGCEHGCIYCFARPSHAWLGLSPGLDFETKIVVRPGAPEVLEAELGRRGYRPEVLAIGTNTDPYQPAEARLGIMRRILEVLEAWGHPVAIVTKGALIERDIDILARMAARGLVHVGISVTTLDARLCRAMEPRAPAPARRLAALSALARAGIPVRVMAAPVVPVLTEPELEPILVAGAAAGARAASWILLRLPLEVAPLFRDWLAREYPGQARHVMNRLRAMRGGADYDAEWGRRMRGEGPYAQILARRFAVAARRLGLDGPLPPLETRHFAPPLARGGQMALF